MNRLKPLFIMGYMLALMAGAVIAMAGALRGADIFAAAGLLLTAAPMLVFLMIVMGTGKVARTTERMPVIMVLGLAGAALSVWAVLTRGAAVEWAGGAAALWLAYLLYAYWYSSFGRKPSPALKAGQSLPGFSVERSDGQTLQSAELTADKSVIVFIRGNWCPLCMGQVNELTAAAADLEAAGLGVHIIAAQSLEKTRALAKNRPAPLAFYSDHGNEAARTLGIANPAGLPFGMEMLGHKSENALPTVIIASPGGKIVWTHETDNYRVRPTPAELIERAAEA